jgi:membrane dipeptidase
MHQEAIVWDNVWPLEPDCGNGLDKLPLFSKAGVTVLSLTIAGDNQDIGEAAQRLAAVRRQVLANPAQLILVAGIDDVHRAKATGRLAITFHFEGTRCFERNLDMVEPFFQLGVKHTLLAFNLANSAGGGCAEKSDGGLTRFGQRLIGECERVGMVIDLSHTGYRTTMEAMERATRPMLFTHSNSATIHPHFRNLSDEQVRACAATGGLVGVSGSSQYLGAPRATTEAIMRHIDHYVQTVGPRHVGLGLDLVFDAGAVDAYMRARPDEWPMTLDPSWPGSHYAQPSQIPELTQSMLDRGYDRSAVLDILGGNYLRIYGEAWK